MAREGRCHQGPFAAHLRAGGRIGSLRGELNAARRRLVDVLDGGMKTLHDPEGTERGSPRGPRHCGPGWFEDRRCGFDHSTPSGPQVIESKGGTSGSVADVPPSVPPTARETGESDTRQGTARSERPAVGIVLTPPYSATGGADVADARRARPDAIRQAIRDLFRVPLNEGRFRKSRDTLGI